MTGAPIAVAFASAAAFAACGGPADPCDGVATACITLHVESSTVTELDQLELDVTYGALHDTITTQAPGGGVTRLPLATSIALDPPAPGTPVGVVVAGVEAGVVQGTGAAQATIDPGAHASMHIQIGPIAACTGGAYYCGGDKLAGDPRTLYQCNGGGVPIARGVCPGECLVRPGKDDTCDAFGGPCTEGALYCGGDELEGNPGTLYHCAAGAGTQPTPCPRGCVVNPGANDACR